MCKGIPLKYGTMQKNKRRNDLNTGGEYLSTYPLTHKLNQATKQPLYNKLIQSKKSVVLDLLILSIMR